MKTIAEWEKEILTITMRINKDFPELSKYIEEMPENMPKKENAEPETTYFKDYYYSLVSLLTDYEKTHQSEKISNETPEESFPGYKIYPPSEDIYSQGIKEMNINPEDITKKKTPIERLGALNEKDFEDDMTGEDLDIPGTELDDQQESVGSEDEENNYYSLGGDNNEDLEEDRS